MVEEEKPTVEKQSMNWIFVLWYVHLHLLGIYGLQLVLFEAKWMTILFVSFVTFVTYIGITVGAHRLWAHQTFKATWHLRFFLVLAHSLASVGPLYNWVLKHRIHHKYYKTDKDPFDGRKGFLYSHVLSNFMPSCMDIKHMETETDVRDIDNDGFVWIQRKFYWIFFVLGLVLPIGIPILYWQESFKCSLFILGFLRLAIACNISWLMHSGVFIWGLNPGDKFPVNDNSVFFVTKSYWLNYHYLFPWDWKSGEFGKYDSDCSTLLIKLFHDIGLVYELRTTSNESVRDALYKIGMKKATVKEALEEVKEISKMDAVKEELRFRH